MILTEKQVKNIINVYAQETNIDIKKYDLYSIANWYNWWYPNTSLWECPASSFTDKENQELIIGRIKHWINDYEWEEKYGYKGNYDGCRKFCNECKHSCHELGNEMCHTLNSRYCSKLSNKYNVLIEVSEYGNICDNFESRYEIDKDLNLKEYFDWLFNAWYVDNKGKTIIQNKTSALTINNVRLIIPYLIYKSMEIIKDGEIQCSQYHAGNWNSRSKKHKLQGTEKIKLIDVLNCKEGVIYMI